MPAPRLMAISDRRALAGEDPPTWAARVSEAGVDTLQLREKDLSDRELLALARAMIARLAPGARMLINGRADVALAAGAQGVHLPAAGIPVAAIRRRFPSLLVGLSTHRLEEVVRARDDGAHYVTFGPVWPTRSKAQWGEPPGLAALSRAAAVGVPVLALGGVSPDRLAAAARAGAAGAAAIGSFLDPAATRLMVARCPFSETSS